jgi:hypothetical protein
MIGNGKGLLEFGVGTRDTRGRCPSDVHDHCTGTREHHTTRP